jgi:hypothetical protein
MANPTSVRSSTRRPTVPEIAFGNDVDLMVFVSGQGDGTISLDNTLIFPR